jgi:hypothetical protein
MAIEDTTCPTCGCLVELQMDAGQDPDTDPASVTGELRCTSPQCTNNLQYCWVKLGTFSGDTPSWDPEPTMGDERAVRTYPAKTLPGE